MATETYGLFNAVVGGSTTIAASYLNDPADVLDEQATALHKNLADGVDCTPTAPTLLLVGSKEIQVGASGVTGVVNSRRFKNTTADSYDGTASAGSATYLDDAGLPGSITDYWVPARIVCNTGANAGLDRDVTGFDSTAKRLTFTAFPNPWANGHTYTVTFLWVFSLTAGIVNYVYGQQISSGTRDTTTKGHIRWYGSASSAKPAGEIYIGTMTLNGGGAVTAVANLAQGTPDMNRIRLEWQLDTSSQAISGLAGGGTTSYNALFAAASGLGAVEATSTNGNFTVDVDDKKSHPTQVAITVTNGAGSAQDGTVTVTRWIMPIDPDA